MLDNIKHGFNAWENDHWIYFARVTSAGLCFARLSSGDVYPSFSASITLIMQVLNGLHLEKSQRVRGLLEKHRLTVTEPV